MIDIDSVARTWKQHFVYKDILSCDSDFGLEHENDGRLANSHSTMRETWLSSLRDFDVLIKFFGEYLCGSSCNEISTQETSVAYVQDGQDHQERRRKRVSYHELVEIREFTAESKNHSITGRKFNSRCVKNDWCLEPSFYRHIDKSKHRTSSYRPPPFVSLPERKRRLSGKIS